MSAALHKFKAELFQALGHPTRVALVEALSEGELSAGALINRLGLEQSNVSQHLAILRAKHVVTTRRAGNQIYYALRDPVLTQILALLRQYFSSFLSETAGMLGEIARQESGPPK